MDATLWCFCGGKCARDGELLVGFSGDLVGNLPWRRWRRASLRGTTGSVSAEEGGEGGFVSSDLSVGHGVTVVHLRECFKERTGLG
jgi:hypothetical protein